MVVVVVLVLVVVLVGMGGGGDLGFPPSISQDRAAIRVQERRAQLCGP